MKPNRAICLADAVTNAGANVLADEWYTTLTNKLANDGF